MKSKALRLPLFLIILILFSCAKETQYLTASPNATSTSSMSAKIDGRLVECPIANAVFFDVAPKKILQILGSKGFEGFALDIEDYKGVGTYDLSVEVGTYMGNSKDADTHYLSSTGTAKITYVDDKVIKGTFEFKGKSYKTNKEVTISEGVFTISLVVPVPPAADPNDKSYTAKIDGVATNFTPGSIVLIKNTPVGNTMTIIGTNGTKTMALAIYDYKGNGTYDMKDKAQGSYNQDNSSTGSFSSDGVGKITITNSTATTIKGTFEFDAPNEDFQIKTTRKITEGTFNVTFVTTTF